MIQHDWISKLSFAGCIGITIYLATYQTTAIVLFPAILLISGLVMELYLERRREHDEDTNRKELRSIGYYSAIGICGILVTGWAVSYVQIPSNLLGITSLSAINVDAVLYSILMAVSEEQFFRGFITDALLSQKIPSISSNPMFALTLSAVIFMAYHWARYQTDLNALIYVFAGGFILAWIAYKSRRLSPSIISHVANNVLAVIGGF